MPDGSPGGVAAGFLLTLPEGNAYFACDTALFYDMKLIGEAGLALAALPIGDNFTMGPDDALRGETARTETRRSHPSGHVAADRPGRPRLGRAGTRRNHRGTGNPRAGWHNRALTTGHSLSHPNA